MKILAQISSILFIALFLYVLVANQLLRRTIDEEKFKEAQLSFFRSWFPPRHVLTPFGAKLWLTRWWALGASLVFLALSCFFYGNGK